MSPSMWDRADADVADLERASRTLFGLTVQAMRAAAGERVSPTGLQALLVLADLESCALTELAARTGLSHSGASRVVDRLVASRLIRRGTSVDDRRRLRLELTAAGRRLAERVISRRRAAISTVAGMMDDADRDGLILGMMAFATAASSAEDDRRAVEESA